LCLAQDASQSTTHIKVLQNAELNVDVRLPSADFTVPFKRYREKRREALTARYGGIATVARAALPIALVASAARAKP
jgi:hypothetical protein